MKKNLLFLTCLFLVTPFLAGCGQGETTTIDTNQRFETTFKNYDQSILYYNTVKYGETAKYQGPTPTRPSDDLTSYYFNGWDVPLENITKDTTFIAQYTTTPTLFEITWLNYNGSLLATTSVEYGKKPVYPGQLPTKPSTSEYSYVFTGWSPEIVDATENATYTAVFEEKPIIQPTDKVELKVFYSVYNPKNHTQIAVFQTKPSDLGSVSTTKECDQGSDVGLYAHPNEGYVFLGWYYKDNLLSKIGDYNFRVWDKDEEVEARFEYALYNFNISTSNSSFGRVSISGDYNPGSSSSRSMYYTEEFYIVAQATDDIRFIGWYSPSNELASNNAVYEISMPNYDYTLIAKWNKFFVTYNLNGGEVSAPLIYDYSYPDSGIRYFDLPTPTRTGYLFQGWKVNGSYETRLDESLLCDFTVVANWIPITYGIVFDGNGSTSGHMWPMSLNYDTSYILYTNEFERTGYTFNGWNTEKDGSGVQYADKESVSNLTTVHEEIVTLYAQWKANKYNAELYYTDPYERGLELGEHTVTFNSNGGTSIDSQTVTLTNGLNYPTIPTRTDYAFTGWYSDSGCTILYDFTKNIMDDLTLYAGWASMTTSYYTRNYFNALNYNSSSNYFNTNTLSYSGNSYYYFTAFNTQLVSFYYRNSSTSTNYRVYYTIFDANTGTSIADGSTVSTAYSSIQINLTEGHAYYIRLYKANNSYSPTFYCYFEGMSARADGGKSGYELFDVEEATYDSSYSFATPSNVPGASFAGWFDANGKQYTNAYGTGLSVWKDAGLVKLYSRWNYTVYSITYYLDGGTNSESNPSTYTVKDCITLDKPIKDGYIFNGWLYLNYQSITEIKYGNYHSNLYIYADWSPITVDVELYVNEILFDKPKTVTFNSNGGSSISSQTVTSTNGLTYPTTMPTRTGYAFTGWYSDSDCTQLYDFTSDVTSDLTLYAGWASMVTSYYDRAYFNALNYNSSSNNFWTNGLYTSSNYSYYYFTAFNTQTVSFYYRNNYTSTSYRIYYAIYDATTGTSIASGSTNSTSYSLALVSLTEGHAYYIRLYKASSSYSPTFYCYFEGMSARADGGFSPQTHIYDVVKIQYDSSTYLPYNISLTGYRFIGWFDSNGTQYTDEYGRPLATWKLVEDITLYPHWELIE